MMHVITVPVAVHNEFFRWQIDLFWYAHQKIYGVGARSKFHAIVVRRNHPWETRVERLQWPMDIPHSMCESFFEVLPETRDLSSPLPLNIQTGLTQVLDGFADDQVIEVTDADLFHFRHHPARAIGDELHVSTVYEDWHLHSLTTNRHIIAPYFEYGGHGYNGGFMPLIGRASTFRRILPEWIAVHIDILKRPFDKLTHWWAGMYALQAACEKARVRMIATDDCFVPGITPLRGSHYIGHYSTSHGFNKQLYPNVSVDGFDLSNPFYVLIRDWLNNK